MKRFALVTVALVAACSTPKCPECPAPADPMTVAPAPVCEAEKATQAEIAGLKAELAKLKEAAAKPVTKAAGKK